MSRPDNARPRWGVLRGIADAGMASLGNLAISLSGARNLDLHNFGVLAALLMISLFAVGMIRVRIADPYVLLYSARPQEEQRTAAKYALGSTFAIAAPISMGLALVALVIDLGTAGAAMLVLAGVLPLLAVQDVARCISYALGNVSGALVGTLVWTLGSLIGIACLIATATYSAPAVLAVWGVSGGIGGAACLARTALIPLIARPKQWLRESREVGVRSVLDFGLTQLSGYGSGLIIAAIAGSAALGALRVAQLPFALVQVVISGCITQLQPRMVIHVTNSRFAAGRRLAGIAGGAITLLVCVVTAVLLLVPNGFWEIVLGAHWQDAQDLVAVVGATLVASAVAASAGLYLRATGDLRFQVRMKAGVAPTSMVAIALGSVGYGALGGAAAQAAGVSAVAGISVLRVLRRRESTESLVPR